jgi:hypothetical protein
VNSVTGRVASEVAVRIVEYGIDVNIVNRLVVSKLRDRSVEIVDPVV